MTQDFHVEETAERLVKRLSQLRSVAVALSGGVDSAVVAKAARLALGDDAVAVIGLGPSLAEGELEQAQQVAATIGIRLYVQPTDELSNPSYVANDGSRCYHCKSELYDRMSRLRQSLGFETLCSGANADDAGDYRPGLKAAAQRNVRHPLQEEGLDKEHVRRLARYWELPNWDKPATPCLASRLAPGVEVSPEKLLRIDRAEQFLKKIGFSLLRVRYHSGDHARIEVQADDIPRLVAMREEVAQRLKSLGFKFVSVDLEGFRSGGLNVLIPSEMLVVNGGAAGR